MLIEKVITRAEFTLLEDIKALQYGEIFDVEVEGDGERDMPYRLSNQQQSLLNLIRAGVQSFQSIKVHQGEPAYGELLTQTASGKYRCKRLYKFN